MMASLIVFKIFHNTRKSIISMPSPIIHKCTRLGFLEHQGQDERLVAPVASGAAGSGGCAGGSGAAGGGGGVASRHQLCLKPCCHDLNTRFSMNKFLNYFLNTI